ncbi:hypothetical protein ZIOFF_049562 [Zingiber officinale]|uniref:SBP-type domain-containing protein n=1 Tax=Zingiber officinale TaxID=94328 RepID=A0A8J5FVE0_ZINOF|nr:hypothetical protein ZIOFF_049562 [Zingiber officinale]
MEWSSSKVPYWDMAELEQGAELNVGVLAGPSFVLGSQSGGLMDCSVDLRLGGLGEFGPPERWLPVPASTAAAAATVPSRRAGEGSNAGASCLVDGCKSDLSNSREYHRRHKVCEVHSKTSMVMLGNTLKAIAHCQPDREQDQAKDDVHRDNKLHMSPQFVPDHLPT